MPTLPKRYKLVFHVPPSHLTQCKTALFATGAGTYPGGKYSHACFETRGTGQFRPNAGADPAIGKVGEVERVEEVKVEMICVGRDVAEKAVRELERVHPYEEVAVEVYGLEDI